MPYEILDLDVSQPEQHEVVLDIYTFWRQHGLDTDLIDEPAIYRDWIKKDPAEARQYAEHCINHENPEIRAYAGLVVDDWAEVDPDFAINSMIGMLADEDETVRNRVIPYYYDVLTDTADELLQKVGALNYHRLIQAYQAATYSPDQE